jgi:2-polyprenyl-3-methyl-5-hydroxy-6-metoxy-1,4-benzoquinol methylase
MDDYFSRARREILPHLPHQLEKILDIGCGEGVTTALIRQQNPSLMWAGGVELFPDAAAQAEKVMDKVWCGHFDKLSFEKEIEPASLDAVLCLDVLEHLEDPWLAVKRISPLIKPEGRLIISIPNIRNWKFIRNLMFKGDFKYRDSGLLDRTHLRFFTRDTALELAEIGGLKVRSHGNAHPWKPFDMRNILSQLTMGGLDDLMIKQFVIVACP